MPRMPGDALPWALAASLALTFGCTHWTTQRPIQPPATLDIQSTDLDYVDSDAFDALFESALVNRDPVITIRTMHTRPDWNGRLNAWIAAWNQGSRLSDGKTVFRGQIPSTSSVTIDGESIREFRFLVDGLLGRAEEVAQTGTSWFRQERLRSRRVALLRPYNLRFHMDEQKFICLIFFHGAYAEWYSRHVQKLTGAMPAEGWSRGVHCSMSPEATPQVERTPGRLTSQERPDEPGPLPMKRMDPADDPPENPFAVPRVTSPPTP